MYSQTITVQFNYCLLNTPYRLRLRPKCLRDVTKVEHCVDILGMHLNLPIGIAPTGFHKIAHPDGEQGTARAAERAGVVYIQSTVSTCSMEEVAEAAGGVKWFQLYIFRDRKETEALVNRAEANGFKAIAVTVDSPIVPIGVIHSIKRNNFEIPPHLKYC